MAETLKILGQLAPSATTLTTLYTVPGATTTQCSTLTICNRGAANATFRVALSPAGAAISNEHYQYYDVMIQGTSADGDTFQATVGWTLGATDVVRVYASSANLSFSLFGLELT